MGGNKSEETRHHWGVSILKKNRNYGKIIPELGRVNSGINPIIPVCRNSRLFDGVAFWNYQIPKKMELGGMMKSGMDKFGPFLLIDRPS